MFFFQLQVSRPLLERSFHRKVQSRKVFTHRESFETIIAKTEEKLSKCRIEYKQCYSVHRQSPTQHSLAAYIDSHNAYVQQLHATNAMLEAYNCETVPQLLQELEEIYSDLCNIVSEAILQGAEAISTRVSGAQTNTHEHNNYTTLKKKNKLFVTNIFV
jgi:SH3 and cysteine-rich domain-containing protein 2